MVDWVTVASLATAADPMVLAVALYVPSGDMSFWQAAIREPDDPDRHVVAEVIEGRKHSLVVDLLYGDHEGGQRTISRFSVTPVGGDQPEWLCAVVRHWNLDRQDPR